MSGERKLLVSESSRLLGDEVRRRLGELCEAAADFTVQVVASEADLGDGIEDAEVVAAITISPDHVAKAKNLKWFNTWAAGVDHALNPALVEHPALITSSKGNGGVFLAEHALMLMLMLAADAPFQLYNQRKHAWQGRFRQEITGGTVGIIGLGHSGMELARKCKSFDMRVLGLRRSQATAEHIDEMFTRDRLQEFLGQCDYLVVTAPMTDETAGMIGADELRQMKRSAFLIVVSRGGIVRDEALLRALNEGWIAGAGLDAHSQEPLPPDSPFWDAPNTIITPHSGATAFGLRTRTLDILIENVRRYREGRPMLNVVDRVARY